MKQLLKNNKTGNLTVTEVPVPFLPEGHVLVQYVASAISLGTEKSSISIAKKSKPALAKVSVIEGSA